MQLPSLITAGVHRGPNIMRIVKLVRKCQDTYKICSYLCYLRGNILNQRLLKIKNSGLDKIKQTSFQLMSWYSDHCVHGVWLKLDKFCDSYFLPKDNQ